MAYHFICPRHAMLLDAGCPNAGGLRESDLEAAVYQDEMKKLFQEEV